MESREIQKVIGKNIDFIRIQKKMSIQEFSKYVNVSSTQLTNVIEGDRGFSITKLLEIAEITGFPIEFILTGRKKSVEDEIKIKLEKANREIEDARRVISEVNALYC